MKKHNFVLIFFLFIALPVYSVDIKIDGVLDEEDWSSAREWTKYYESQKKLSETNYKYNILHGRFTHWHENGRKYTEVFYTKGKKHQWEVGWHEDGAHRLKLFWFLGKQDGEQIEGEYSNGFPKGIWRSFSEDGTMIYQEEEYGIWVEEELKWWTNNFNNVTN